MTEPTLHPRKQLLFALLSAADFGLTWWLLSGAEGHAYEANPVAGWWLARFGWLGLACFKAAVVALVLALATLITRYRPRAAGRVLKLGCCCLAAVVLYSAALGGSALWGAGAEDADFAAIKADLDVHNRQRAAANRRREPFRTLVRQLREDLLAGRCSLREAADRLEAREGHNPEILGCLAAFDRNLPLSQRFACLLVCNAVSSLGNDLEGARRLALRLEHQFQSGYGALPPRDLRLQLSHLHLDRADPDDSSSSAAQAILARMP